MSKMHDYEGNSAKLRQDFHNLARGEFPNVGEPGTVWVLHHALGWDMEEIAMTLVEGFSRSSYKRFVIDPMTNQRLVSPDTKEFVKITRKWTSQEKTALAPWWWLLGF